MQRGKGTVYAKTTAPARLRYTLFRGGEQLQALCPIFALLYAGSFVLIIDPRGWTQRGFVSLIPLLSTPTPPRVLRVARIFWV